MRLSPRRSRLRTNYRRPSGIRQTLEPLESRQLLATFSVTSVNDSGPGTLRQAILDANSNPGPDFIEFSLAATNTPGARDNPEYPGMDRPADGFDILTQTWRIELASPLPRITELVTIDSFTQAHFPVPFYYPTDVDLPTFIRSSSSTLNAQTGNNAQSRVILDGSQINRILYPAPIGLNVGAAHAILRGFAIEGFEIGLLVGNPTGAPLDAEGVLIQGNFIGKYPVFPVDLQTGEPLASTLGVGFAGVGNSSQGILINATNATIGGTSPQDQNAIAGNGADGIWIVAQAQGNQVVGNQIGVVGPTESGYYFSAGNGGSGVVVQSALNAIGGSAPGAGNVISANHNRGVHLLGPSATLNRIEGNYIGVAPGGGFRFGSGDPGNRTSGILIEDAPSNIVGGTGDDGRNVISANDGAGIRIMGASTSTWVRNNIIGLVADGSSALGNSGPGVLVETANNTIDTGNIISANLRGVDIRGAAASGNTVRDNFIGTDITGVIDIGNALEGVLVHNAPTNRILGDGNGSQLISGNDVGVAVFGPNSTGATVSGNHIGLDSAGLIPIGNSKEGVRITNAPDAVVGVNQIVGNFWGVVLEGPSTVGANILGNVIRGSDAHGVWIRQGANSNLIGTGNSISDNRGSGVIVEGGDRNAIRQTEIVRSGELGIDLIGNANNNTIAPVLTAVVSGGGIISAQGTLSGLPNSTYTIDVFTNTLADPSGSGEGERYLGSTSVTTSSTGLGFFAFQTELTLPPGQFFSATATDVLGNTSEFSEVLSAGTASVEFMAAAFDVNESAGSVTVTVVRSGVTEAQATVGYATQNISAVAGQDYAAVAGTLVFEPGEQSKTFTVPIINDLTIEGDEAFRVLLSNPTDAASLGPQSTAIVTIRDDDHQPVSFATTSYVVNEGGSATITVVRQGATTAAASVSYATGGGTATPGSDYVPASGVLTFAPGQRQAIITIQTLDDSAIESDETILVSLSNPVGLTLTGPSVATVTIRDNDQPGVVQIITGAFQVREDKGAVWVVVTRTGGTSGRVTVPYATAPGTANPGEDYLPVSGTIVFEPGQTISAFVVPIVDDRNVEGNESFYVAIGHPSGGATLGPQWVASVTITDNDFDVTPPRVLGVETMTRNGMIVGFTVTFSEPLDPARARDPYNYDSEIVSAGRDGRFGTVDDIAIPIRSVSYQPGMNTAVVTPERPLVPTLLYLLQINRFLGPVAGSGVADVAGNLLDGDGDGLPGGKFVAVLGSPLARRRVAWR